MAMENSPYSPVPIEVDGVEVPPELAPLVELLAENTHDLWARQRLQDGWTWGPARNDERKHHPGLVHYAELPASEQEYDRIIVVQTLKTIVKLGYDVRKRSE